MGRPYTGATHLQAAVRLQLPGAPRLRHAGCIIAVHHLKIHAPAAIKVSSLRPDFL